MYQDFALVGMDQLVNQACNICSMSGGTGEGAHRLPRAGGDRVAGGGAALPPVRELVRQHARDQGGHALHPVDAKGLLKSAIRDDNPVLYLENRMLFNTSADVPDGEWLVPIGEAEVKRAGRT